MKTSINRKAAITFVVAAITAILFHVSIKMYWHFNEDRANIEKFITSNAEVIEKVGEIENIDFRNYLMLQESIALDGTKKTGYEQYEIIVTGHKSKATVTLRKHGSIKEYKVVSIHLP